LPFSFFPYIKHDEKFPADDLGARSLSTFLLSNKIAVHGIVVLDMISWRKNKTDSIVQINSGRRLTSFCFGAFWYVF